AALDAALATPELLTITIASYFETPLNWDIAYQLHAMGFKRIDTLRHHVRQLVNTPDNHIATVQALWKNRKDQKDHYLIQLLNRAYLVIHPAPEKTYLQRYYHARYVTGQMYRNPEDKPDLDADMAW